MTMLVSTLETVDRQRPISMPWLSTSTASYLERMDFFQDIHVDGVELPRDRGRRHQSTNLVEIKRLFGTTRSEEIADQLATSIASSILGRPPKPFSFSEPDEEHDGYCVPLRYALSELIENSLTHARREGKSGAGVWVASQYYQGSHVQIAVVDNGCGFLATLKNHPELGEQTHTAAILTALKSKVSCNRDLGPYLESVNEGVGLTTTVRIAKATSGRVSILSGDGIVVEGNNPHAKRNERASQLPSKWNGVAISAVFECDNLSKVNVGDHLPPVEKTHKAEPPRFVLRFDE